MKNLLFLIITLLLIISSPIYAKETLRFATDPNDPPFENINLHTGKVVGFDIDIVNALCKRMISYCEFFPVPWRGMLLRIKNGEYDAAVQSIEMTPARRKVVDFTNSYLNITGSFIAASEPHLNITKQGIMHHTIGVSEESTYETYAIQHYKNIAQIKSYRTIEQALAGLAKKQVDYVMGDTPTLEHWLNNQVPGDYEILGKVPYDVNIMGKGIGIAVRKGNTKLLDALNKALSQIKADGTYNKIYNEYFGVEEM